MMDEAEITFQIARYRPANQAPAAEPPGGPGRLCNPQLRGLRREGRSEPLRRWRHESLGGPIRRTGGSACG